MEKKIENFCMQHFVNSWQKFACFYSETTRNYFPFLIVLYFYKTYQKIGSGLTIKIFEFWEFIIFIQNIFSIFDGFLHPIFFFFFLVKI